MPKKYENIKMVFHTLKYEDANEKLAAGYRLLDIYSARIPTSNNDALIQPCYVLGSENGDRQE